MRKFVGLTLLLAMLAALGQAGAQGAWSTAYVTGGAGARVHLRAEPSQQAASLGLYFSGTPVNCEGSPEDEWVQVRIGTEEGYMMGAFLTDGMEEIATLSWRQTGTVRTDSFVNLRDEPGTGGRVIRELTDGEGLVLLGETADGWYHVDAGGLDGYVMAKFVAPDAAGEAAGAAFVRPEVVDAAAGARFWHVQAQAYLRPEDVGDALHDGLQVTYPRFALSDVDRDGSMELVLAQTVAGDEYYGYLVLKAVDGGVWGYEVPYRGMLSPRTDGTCAFSSGANDNGQGWLGLGDFLVLHNVASCQSDSTTPFRVVGLPATMNAYNAAMATQARKPEVIWRDVTPDSLARVRRLSEEFAR